MTASFAPQPIDRRSFVQQAVAGLGLGFAWPTLDARAAKRRGSERPTSLITLFLDGGPSQLETWDPHPGTPIGGDTTQIKTRLPGLTIGSDYQQTAEIINELSVIRSLVSSEGNHARGLPGQDRVRPRPHAGPPRDRSHPGPGTLGQVDRDPSTCLAGTQSQSGPGRVPGCPLRRAQGL